MSHVQISRDPFARQELVRRTIYSPKVNPPVCDWCGSRARFQYGTWRDGSARPDYDLRVFCSVGCYRSFHS